MGLYLCLRKINEHFSVGISPGCSFALILLPLIFYREYHEKILKSYLIDSKIENKTFTINVDAARAVIDNALDSKFERKKNNGIEEAFEFENDDGLGRLYTYKDQIIHLSYFTKLEDIIEDEINNENIPLETDV